MREATDNERGDSPNPATAKTVDDILAEMREVRGFSVPFAPMRAVFLLDFKDFVDRLEAAYKRENHCKKRYDKDGDEMPPHCAFDDLKIDRLQAKINALTAAPSGKEAAHA